MIVESDESRDRLGRSLLAVEAGGGGVGIETEEGELDIGVRLSPFLLPLDVNLDRLNESPRSSDDESSSSSSSSSSSEETSHRDGLNGFRFRCVAVGLCCCSPPASPPRVVVDDDDESWQSSLFWSGSRLEVEWSLRSSWFSRSRASSLARKSASSLSLPPRLLHSSVVGVMTMPSSPAATPGGLIERCGSLSERCSPLVCNDNRPDVVDRLEPCRDLLRDGGSEAAAGGPPPPPLASRLAAPPRIGEATPPIVDNGESEMAEEGPGHGAAHPPFQVVVDEPPPPPVTPPPDKTVKPAAAGSFARCCWYVRAV